jgi:hypothetical protein
MFRDEKLRSPTADNRAYLASSFWHSAQIPRFAWNSGTLVALCVISELYEREMRNTIDVFIREKGLLEKSLEKTKRDYRAFDPGSYLYHQVVKYKGDKYSNDFIELVYVTLTAWNMNSRGARLADFDIFKKSIITNQGCIESLNKYRLNLLEESEIKIVINCLKYLYSKLALVDIKKPKFVTFTKTLHFFLTDLIPPMDRSYTLTFFNGHTNLPNNIDKQIKLFEYIFREYWRLAKNIDLYKQLDNRWNLNIPKVCDNAVIGYCKIRPCGALRKPVSR